MTKGQKIALIVAGIVTLVSGVGFLVVRNRRKKSEDNPYEEEYTNPVVSEVYSGSTNNPQTETSTSKPSSDSVADETVKKGSQGEAAKGVQVIINEIARWRGWSGQTKKAPNGKSVKFPIGTDGDFGTNSDTAARLIFDNYQADLSTTRHKARMKWAYAAGFYKKPFPDGLKNVSRRADYTNEFIRGGKASK